MTDTTLTPEEEANHQAFQDIVTDDSAVIAQIMTTLETQLRQEGAPIPTADALLHAATQMLTHTETLHTQINIKEAIYDLIDAVKIPD